MHEPTIQWSAGESARRRLGNPAFLADWGRLYDACPWATPFQHPRFVQAWYGVHARRVEPVLVTGESASGLSGVLALARPPESAELMVVGGDEALYQGWLTPPGGAWRFLALALEHVQQQTGLTRLSFQRLPPRLPMEEIESGAGARVVSQEQPGASVLLGRLSEGPWADRVRARAAGALAVLEPEPALRMERVSEPDDVRALFELVFPPSADGDAPSSAGAVAIPGVPSRQLLDAELRHGGPVHASALWSGERLISAHIGHADRGVLHIGAMGVCAGMDGASARALHLLELTQQAESEELYTLDLMALDLSEREGLANHEGVVRSLDVFRSRGGRVRRPTAITTARHLAAEGLRRVGVEPRGLRERLPAPESAASAGSRRAHALIGRLLDLQGQRLSTRRGLYEQARSLGLFELARRVTGGQLRILGYHAFSDRDHAELDPYLFMRLEVFERRLELLKKLGIPVLGLGDALSRLAAGRLPDCATVLTFDDGFISTFEAMEAVRRHGMDGTVYVATRYIDQPTPVVDVTLRYLAWRSAEPVLSLDGLGLSAKGTLATDDTDAVVEFAITAARELEDLEQANTVMRRVADRLGQDYDALLESRALSFATSDEVRDSAAKGTDIQLHTHSHELPTDPALAREEICRNRDELSAMVSAPLEHFAYPSGIWSPHHFPALHELGITSAVTCDAGLNRPDVNLLELSRFIDSDAISEVVFEAEISGFAELLRGVRRGLRAVAGSR